MSAASRRVTVTAAAGIHARTATALAQLATTASGSLRVVAGDAREADAASVIALMTLDVDRGDEVELCADGIGAEALLDAAEAILAPRHGAGHER